MRHSLQKTHRIFSVSLGILVLIIGISAAHCSAETEMIRHEIRTEIRWNSEDYIYDNYIINGEPEPGVSARLDREYLLVTSSYAFFFTPVTENEEIPITLRRFYDHPTTFRIYFSLQPEAESTYVHQNREINYRSSRFRDERSRSAGLDVEYYPWDNTGLLFQLRSTKNEEDVRTSNTLNNRGVGENNEIRRYYGFGISQYLFTHLNIKLMYTTFDFEYVGTEKTWAENSPLLFTEFGREADTDGQKILVSGQYILRKFLGIRGFYEFWDQNSHSNILSSFYDNFPGLDSYYDTDTTNQTLGASISLYFNNKTTFRIGGSIAWQENEVVYETDQIIEHDWNITTVETEISHYVNRHIGVRMGYEFAKRDGDVLIWHPETESDPRTEYFAESDFHAVYVGLTGRF